MEKGKEKGEEKQDEGTYVRKLGEREKEKHRWCKEHYHIRWCVHAHVCCSPWPSVCPCHRTFPSTSSAWKAGGPIGHLMEEGRGGGVGRKVEVRELPQAGK